MKYYIFSAIALFAMLMTSCKNDDITISAPSTVNINAAGVIAPFTYQYEWGELETFGSSYKLRIRALIYNERGELVKKETNLFDNYNVQLQTSDFFSPGNYTVIGISDVVEASGNSVSFEYWSLSGEDKISELKVSDLGYVGLFAKVLGVAKNTLYVQESHSNSVNVNLEPAGALIYTFFYNRDALSKRNVTEYQLRTNKSSEAICFDNNGSYRVIEENDGSTEFLVASTDAEDGGAYSYNFLLPMNNLKLWFNAIINGEPYTFGTDEGAIVDVVAGEEYICELSLNSNVNLITTSYSYANKSRTRTEGWADGWNKRLGACKAMTDIKKKMSQQMYNSINTVLTVDDIQ